MDGAIVTGTCLRAEHARKNIAYKVVCSRTGGLDLSSQSGSKKGTLMSSVDKTFTGAISSLRRNDDAWLEAEVLNFSFFLVPRSNCP